MKEGGGLVIIVAALPSCDACYGGGGGTRRRRRRCLKLINKIRIGKKTLNWGVVTIIVADVAVVLRRYNGGGVAVHRSGIVLGVVAVPYA